MCGYPDAYVASWPGLSRSEIKLNEPWECIYAA